MLVFPLAHKQQMKEITSDLTNNLHLYELMKDEWKIAEELRDMLKILKDATLFFSHGSPSLPDVIPAMDHIDALFTIYCMNPKSNPAICALISIAKKTLNYYYSLTDYSEVYQIAMILHPGYKLEYFKSAGWEQEWIDVAEGLV
ncbi:hypothetical protein BDN70DRAFT_909489 [Pholiota conissans]|uniref:Uncharacterized protein n=1 Tax=Pholiota conissans TaxID=109636 RepID=A0A9P5YL79_9AGAR|nr:hypothetical protein BDN70DRAFT_909489 [Pholiota conissans]